jgi:catechol 2,3-dioxygenase-like lactoylglutathione lyase family enzyme
VRAIPSIDLIVRDVPAATAFFRDVVGLELQVAEERFAQLVAGDLIVMLSPDALIPTSPAAGVILHVQVDDVGTALEAARSRGAQVLLEPTRTDWGTESAMIAGPDGITVDFFRQLPAAEPAPGTGTP